MSTRTKSRKERFNKIEIGYLFYSIVIPNLTAYGRAVHGASNTELNGLNFFQQFLLRPMPKVAFYICAVEH